MAQTRTSVSIEETIFAAAEKASLPENENRTFSNLCETALKDYLETRGYLTPTNEQVVSRAVAKTREACDEVPELAPKVEKFIRTELRKAREGVAS